MNASFAFHAKLAEIWPEIILGIGAVVVLFVGLSKHVRARRLCATLAGLALVAAGVASLVAPPDNAMSHFYKVAVAGLGLLCVMVAAQVPEKLTATLEGERIGDDITHTLRGEFFAFFLLSVAGAMLCGGADDLVWLFLALELTSLPTYVMVSISRDRAMAQEAGVKYFFLGALAAAMFVYGFALMYGATGSTQIDVIRAYVHANGASPLFTAGLMLSVLGVGFKVAAFPMHAYVADVYQGASIGVTTLLAVVPKAAGFVSLILLVSMVGWPLAETSPAVMGLLWAMAALTMVVGNILGLLQSSVKRVLAYSSIAHSGYMLMGLLVGAGDGDPITDGTAAILYYLVAYGLGTVTTFSILGCLRSKGEEAETFDDLHGLANRHRVLAGFLLISVLSMIGLPPMVGFLGKMYVLSAAVSEGYMVLVLIALLNSAVGAVYYLRILSASFFPDDTGTYEAPSARGRWVAAGIGAVLTAVLGLAGGRLVAAAKHAAEDLPRSRITQTIAGTSSGVEPMNTGH